MAICSSNSSQTTGVECVPHQGPPLTRSTPCSLMRARVFDRSQSPAQTSFNCFGGCSLSHLAPRPVKCCLSRLCVSVVRPTYQKSSSSSMMYVTQPILTGSVQIARRVAARKNRWHRQNMPKLLELYCGTKSVGKVFENAGWEVVSVDLEPRFKPTLCMSVLDIELDRWEPGTFAMIWSSPPCTLYSKARTTGEKVDMEASNLLVLHTVNLIRALKPKFWGIENPLLSSIWLLECLKYLPFVRTSYCKYAPEWLYRKNTRIATNLAQAMWRPKFCHYDCLALVPGKRRHIATAQRGPARPGDKSFSQEKLYRVPPKLIQEMLDCITDSFSSRNNLEENPISGGEPWPD